MENNDIVIINLDKPRELRLTNKVLKRFSASQKIGMNEIEVAINRYDVMVALIYEMLKLDDPTLTPEKCDDLLDMASIGEIINACAQAIAVAFDTGDKEESKDPTKGRRNMIG